MSLMLSCRPGDFVAFKLDIDTEAIEQSLMKQIADDDALFGMISEMFFEQHHNGTEVSAWSSCCALDAENCVCAAGTQTGTVQQTHLTGLPAMRHEGWRVSYQVNAGMKAPKRHAADPVVHASLMHSECDCTDAPVVQEVGPWDHADGRAAAVLQVPQPGHAIALLALTACRRPASRAGVSQPRWWLLPLRCAGRVALSAGTALVATPMASTDAVRFAASASMS